jgi:hypothetical protein
MNVEMSSLTLGEADEQPSLVQIRQRWDLVAALLLLSCASSPGVGPQEHHIPFVGNGQRTLPQLPRT